MKTPNRKNEDLKSQLTTCRTQIAETYQIAAVKSQKLDDNSQPDKMSLSNRRYPEKTSLSNRRYGPNRNEENPTEAQIAARKKHLKLPIDQLFERFCLVSFALLDPRSLGFIFLTIGILSGAVWANEAWGSYWSWDPKETWAFITWIVFAIYLHTRTNKNLQGTNSAIVATIDRIPSTLSTDSERTKSGYIPIPITGVNIIPIAITKVMAILGIKRYFWLVIIPKKTITSATKPLIPGNASEAMEKLLNIVNIFGMGIATPPISSR
ncbi:cytochrome c biogenesis protein ycf5, chloroplast [Artemisia annua]|uniref:Cytochrome c biogenesis protein ycf5, chloroplast n=1 Tax=Artemisia annua TaxID=35608 RepID=A0A2U1MU42_ARTAN|nr:cytochrome c biogenesis protein ycf5, chloroplast [Artemisia annua]